MKFTDTGVRPVLLLLLITLASTLSICLESYKDKEFEFHKTVDTTNMGAMIIATNVMCLMATISSMLLILKTYTRIKFNWFDFLMCALLMVSLSCVVFFSIVIFVVACYDSTLRCYTISTPLYVFILINFHTTAFFLLVALVLTILKAFKIYDFHEKLYGTNYGKIGTPDLLPALNEETGYQQEQDSVA